MNMIPDPQQGHPWQMFYRMHQQIEKYFYPGDDKMDLEQTLDAIDESEIDALRRSERFFTDITHQLLENRFNDYAGVSSRRLYSILVEVKREDIALLYARSIRRLATAEAKGAK